MDQLRPCVHLAGRVLDCHEHVKSKESHEKCSLFSWQVAVVKMYAPVHGLCLVNGFFQVWPLSHARWTYPRAWMLSWAYLVSVGMP